jgi:hypothetical protein
MSNDISFNNLTPYARLLLQPASNNIFENSSQYQLESIFSLLRNRTNTSALLNSDNIRTYPQIINNINDQSNVRIPPVDSDWGDFLTNFILNSNSSQNYRQNSVQDLLQQTLLQEKNNFKNVLSQQGGKQLKTIKYNNQMHSEQPFCVITQKPFENNMNVTQLPCDHIFEPSGILYWVTNKNATCPVCRFKLHSKEKRIQKINFDYSNNVIDLSNVGLSNNNSQQRLRTNRRLRRMIRNLEFIQSSGSNSILDASTNINPNRNIFSGYLERQEHLQEERDLQEALMRSLMP